VKTGKRMRRPKEVFVRDSNGAATHVRTLGSWTETVNSAKLIRACGVTPAMSGTKGAFGGKKVILIKRA
jgi:hypothetical protein